MKINKNWIELLFKRFDEIYAENAISIPKNISQWEETLEGITAETIKKVLAICKKDNSVLMTSALFKVLCDLQQDKTEPTVNIPVNAPPDAIPATPMQKHANSYSLLYKQPESENTVGNGESLLERDNRLLCMSELEAMGLSTSDKYDRIRLLASKQGRENVARLQALAPPVKPQVKRKDWE